MSDVQRVSTDLLEWQLDMIVREEPYLDYSFPLNQFNGFNVNVVEMLTVRHPLSTQRDAENYVAALDQVATRIQEALTEAKRQVAAESRPFRLASSLKRLSLR